MIIDTKNLSKEDAYFTSSPIYFLTNNLQLTKFFHILSSSQVAYGTRIEYELRSFILDNCKHIKSCSYNDFQFKKSGIWLNKDKKMVADKLPDIIIYNADDKIITNAEIKIRADRTSGKGIPNDINGNKAICEELQTKFSGFKVDNIVVTLFEPQGPGNMGVWKKLGANVMLGKDFLKDYFQLNLSDFRERLNLNVEVNNKTILKLLNDVKKSTQIQLKKGDFSSEIGRLE